MKKILVFIFAFLMIFAQQAFGETYNITPSNQNTIPASNECDIPPFSSTVSPYTNQGKCSFQQQPNNMYENQQYTQYSVQQGQYYNNPYLKPQFQQGQGYNQNMPPQFQQGQPQQPQYSTERPKLSGNQKTIADLPPGAFVIDSNSVWEFRGHNYSGEVMAKYPIIWQKLEDNHYTSGTTLFISKYEIAHIHDWRLNKNIPADWSNSNPRDFLRETFYNSLSPKFKNAIAEVYIPYYDLNGNLQNIMDNFFLLSVEEWGLSKKVEPEDLNRKEGTPINFSNIKGIYGFDTPDINDKSSLISFGAYSNPTRTLMYMLRYSKFNHYGYNTYDVQDFNTVHIASSYHIRPAVNLKSSAIVTGPYKLTRKVFGKDQTLEYYELQ